MAQRGRKKGAIGTQSRALLLTIATEEFALNGFHDTKISTIVNRAGLTQPTFYLYFRNKEAIFRELVDSFQSNLFRLVKSSRLDSGIEKEYVSDRIKLGLSAILHFFSENPDLTRIGLVVAPKSEEIKKELAALLEENLSAEQQDGYFINEMDMSIVAESLVGIIVRVTIIHLFERRRHPEELAAEIVRLLLYGMQARSEMK
ncbi:TetR/AcrR family transcriptional regulator [Brevibacillus sp. SIMBA_040]|uniref:TetR/AcrR family transcriptional regulator n=1 Tax=unclassified Brevibacillus TaxID=2684853 RepID=UPI00397B1683